LAAVFEIKTAYKRGYINVFLLSVSNKKLQLTMPDRQPCVKEDSCISYILGITQFAIPFSEGGCMNIRENYEPISFEGEL
jgi:hypothetical protein